MKKIKLLCLESRKGKTLEAVRELGVLHVVSLRRPAGEELEAARKRRDGAARALGILNREFTEAGEQPEEISSKPDEAVESVMKYAEEREALKETISLFDREIARMEPLGDFDPEQINALADKGILVRVYRASAKEPPAPPDGTVLTELYRDKGALYFALSGAARAFEAGFPYDPYPLSSRSLSELKRLRKNCRKETAESTQIIRQYIPLRKSIERRIAELEDTVRMLEVGLGMQGEERLALLQGFCPERLVPAVTDSAAQQGWGIIAEDPSPDDRVPTQVEYPKLVRPIKAVFNLLQILPGYREADISAVFLLFFSLFFAMLIGDAGYGALFLLGTLAVRAKFKNAPREPFVLMSVLSVATILWGVITGNYFGMASLPAPLKGVTVNWLLEQRNLMKLCFLIGAVHLTIAHAWNAAVLYPRSAAFAQIGWVCLTWTMYFAAGAMVLQEPFPSWVFALFGGGLLLVALFITPPRKLKAEWINHAMLPLNVVSNFVDVISYIRLFAVGMATVSVAQSFNNMALSAGFNNVLTGSVAALILVVGHGLNILLGGLAILVHGVRLNTLEFSLHKNMQWSGFPYQPFERRSRE